MLYGFRDNEHRAAFARAAAQHRFGGDRAGLCGARTRGGGSCRSTPLSGQRRCLKHAGPKAARAHRDAQIADLAAGRLDAETFERHERRRARNKLHALWKKEGPWIPGVTIDLGEHEGAFQEALAAAGWALARLPPAIADALRWRFRRAVLDRSQPELWVKALEKVHGLMLAAGDPPEELPVTALAMISAVPVPDRLSPFSRRRAQDRAPADTCKPVGGRAKPVPIPPITRDEAASILIRHRADIAPVLQKCGSDEERLRVAEAYKWVLDGADEGAARRAWINLLQRLDSHA